MLMSQSQLRPRSSYRHWTQIATRWSDNDVYGHVNNVVFYSWFDTAVNGFLIESGLLDLENSEVIGLVVNTECRYAAPVSFPQSVEIGLSIAKAGTSSVHYYVGVFLRNAAEAAAEGRFVHVYVDHESRRPMALPVSWRKRLQTIAC